MTKHDQHDPEGADREAQNHPEGNATQRTDDPQMGVVLDSPEPNELADVPQDMADPSVPGPRDVGVPGELENDKMLTEDLLRGDDELDRKNVNDEPGFMDGRLGGEDGEERSADAVEDDVRGEAHGGVGAGRSSGFDGGPTRK